MRELSEQRGMAVYFDAPYFAQIPQALIRDPEVSDGLKVLYGLYHSYAANTKDLALRPASLVTQEMLAANQSVHRRTIIRRTQKLEALGWLTVVRRGLNQSNAVILHGRRARRS